MRKIAILFFIVFVVFSCKDNIEEDESGRYLKFASGTDGSLSIGFRSLEQNSFEIDLVNDCEFDISAKAVLPEGFEIYYFNFYMVPAEGFIHDEYWSIRPWISNTFNSAGYYSEYFKIYRGGNFKIWGEIVFNNIEDRSVVKTVKSEEISLTVLYPDRDAIQDGIKDDMDDLWKKSISVTNQTEMREFGFFITMEIDGRALKVKPVEKIRGEPNNCPRKGETVAFTLDFDWGGSEISTTSPLEEEATYYIGMFHTHPPLTNCSSTTTRAEGVGPSKADEDILNELDAFLPAFVYDYKDDITGGHRPNASGKIYHYGADRRKDFYD